MLRQPKMIEPEFLKELLGILGEPTNVIVRTYENSYEDDSMKLSTRFTDRYCKCDNSKILEIYEKQFKHPYKLKGEKEEIKNIFEIDPDFKTSYSIKELTWTDMDKEAEIYTSTLYIKFNPIDLSVEIDRNAKKETYEKLMDTIKKYKPPHTIKLI